MINGSVLFLLGPTHFRQHSRAEPPIAIFRLFLEILRDLHRLTSRLEEDLHYGGVMIPYERGK